MAAAGEISVGQMVAVYGYVAILVVPVWFLIEGGYQLIRGRVAARRVIAVLNVASDEVGGGSLPAPGYPADLHDPQTSFVVRHGQLTAVACEDPADGIALADRLGRFASSDVTWGGIPLVEIALDDVRSRILVADHDSYVFAGSLREILLDKPDALIDSALHTASARDVVDSLPDGLDTDIDNRARRLSGGQRQRVRLARALLAEPDVLILIDPTSAVDAHTEARIGQRLRDGRAGRTTVVVATSSLLLGCVDSVAYVRDGQVVATGTHDDLLDSHPGYRALVSRDSLLTPESEALR
jgi:ABC-type multidrug transport system fused ATPase/permease subunit